MDPFSVAVGITGLVAVAAQALQLAQAYKNSQGRPRESAAALVMELKGLQSNLMRLNTFLLTEAGQGLAFKHTSVLSASVSAFERQITSLCAKMKLVQESRTKQLLWPFNKSEHVQILGNIRAFSEWIQFGLSIDGCALLARTSDDVLRLLQQQISTISTLQEVRESNNELRSSIRKQGQDINGFLRSKAREDVINWISASDYDQKHNAIRLPRVTGTGGWLLSNAKYKTWRDGAENSNFGVMGFKALVNPSLVIDQLRHSVTKNDQVLAFVYFDYRDSIKQSASQIATSLLKQILCQLPTTPPVIADMYKDRQMVNYASISEIEIIILSILKTVPRAYLVIDALDECDAREHRPEFIQLLVKVSTNPNIRIFVTSRSYPADIRTALESYPQIIVEAHDLDLRLYLRQELEKVYDAGIIDVNFAEEIAEKLLKKAQGLFLLAVLHLHTILKEPTAGDMEDALATISKDLPEAFAETIARIQRLPKGRSKLGMSALIWTCYAETLFTIDELVDALAVRLGQTARNSKYKPTSKLVLECCQGLIVIEPDSMIVRLAHYSIQEYLVGQGDSLFPRPHAEIAEACLTYLMMDSFTSGSCQDEESLKTRMISNPLLYFAASRGFDHVRLAGDDANTSSLMWQFFASSGAIASCHQIRRYGGNYRELYWDPKECESVTPCHFAAMYDLRDAMPQILDHFNISINVTTKIGTTPLISAASKGHVEMVQMLLDRGANPYLSNWYGNSLHCAAEAGESGPIEALIKHGVDPNIRRCCMEEDFTYESVDSNSDYGVSCSSTPLHCTTDHDHAAAAETLLANGADKDARTHQGMTFFHLAIVRGCKNIVEMLLSKSYVDVNGKMETTGVNHHSMALHIAVSHGCEPIVRLLLAAGANPDMADSHGQKPAFYRPESGGKVIGRCGTATKGADSRGLRCQPN